MGLGTPYKDHVNLRILSLFVVVPPCSGSPGSLNESSAIGCGELQFFPTPRAPAGESPYNYFATVCQCAFISSSV